MTTLPAPAKLTTSLRVVGTRPDGYHLIEAEMVSLDLADQLTFRPGDGLEVTGPCAAAVPTGADNLVARALTAAGRRAHVILDKRIPPMGGLGGGSSDAAAVLRWAGIEDVGVAARLGADVAFCLRGGRARVTGIGEQLRALPYEARTFTLLTPPGLGCPTAEVYRTWDALGGPSGDGANDLEPAALHLVPELGRWREELAERSGQVPTLAGSGSTWFVEGAHEGPGLRVVCSTPAHD